MVLITFIVHRIYIAVYLMYQILYDQHNHQKMRKMKRYGGNVRKYYVLPQHQKNDQKMKKMNIYLVERLEYIMSCYICYCTIISYCIHIIWPATATTSSTTSSVAASSTTAS
eukprot:101257_1